MTLRITRQRVAEQAHFTGNARRMYRPDVPARLRAPVTARLIRCTPPAHIERSRWSRRSERVRCRSRDESPRHCQLASDKWEQPAVQPPLRRGRSGYAAGAVIPNSHLQRLLRLRQRCQPLSLSTHGGKREACIPRDRRISGAVRLIHFSPPAEPLIQCLSRNAWNSGCHASAFSLERRLAQVIDRSGRVE